MPLRELIEELPEELNELLELLSIGDLSLLDQVGLKDFDMDFKPNKTSISGAIIITESISFDLVGVEGMSVALLSEGEATSINFSAILESNRFELKIIDASISIRLDPNILTPVKLENNKYIPDSSKEYVEIKFALTFGINSETGVFIDKTPSISIDPFMIGSTGIIIEVSDINIYLDAESPPPGKPNGWRGIHIGHAGLYLPGELGATIGNLELVDAYIGTGGFSGIISNTWTPPLLINFLGAELTLNSVDLTLVQNSFSQSKIIATLLLPFFNEPVDVEIGISIEGGFTVKLASDNGLFTFEKENILSLTLDSLGFEIFEGVFTAKLSGKLTPLFGAPGLEWPAIQVDELSIDSEGNVNIEGGWLDLREGFTLNLYGFQFDITKLGFGKTDDGGNFVGLSGAIKLTDGIPAGASVEGLRVIWYPNGDIRITLEGVGVEFEIEDVLRFKGAVAYRELEGADGPVHRFDGAIKLELLVLDLTIDANIVFGRGPYPFFAIYLGVELPAAIPIFSGIGLYGFAGLFALNMEPDKQENEPWYGIGEGEGWYKRSPIGVAELSKWTNREGSFALGGGVTIGTLSDNGYTVSAKALLVLIFPGPIIMIEGKANILKERKSLDEEPLFRALAVLDLRENYFLMGIDAAFKYDDSGSIIDLRGGTEFYFKNASDWHIYIGIDEPREKRIKASIFKLFTAEGYFMLSNTGLKTGAWIGIDEKWKFGPLSVILEAWLEGKADISWKPLQFMGSIWVHGKVELKIFFFKLGLSADAKLSASVNDPFHIRGDFSVCISLPWPFDDACADITLEWGPDQKPPPLPLPLKEIAIEHFQVSTCWPLPRSNRGDIVVPKLLLPNYDTDADGFLNSDDGFTGLLEPSNFDDIPVVPLDCRPHITFGRPINDPEGIGLGGQEINPNGERIGDPNKDEGPALVKYDLEEIALEKKHNSDWITLARKPLLATDGEEIQEIFGSWAPLPEMPDRNGEFTTQTKLWIWSKNPFDYTLHAGREWDEWFTDRFPKYPCVPPPPDRKICCNFNKFHQAKMLDFPLLCLEGFFIGEKDNRSTFYIKKLSQPVGGKFIALCSDNPSTEGLLIQFPEIAKWIKVTFLKPCISFEDLRVRTGPNPRENDGVTIEVFNQEGISLPQTELIVFGESIGLFCETHTEITFPNPTSSVDISISCTSSEIDSPINREQDYILAIDKYGNNIDKCPLEPLAGMTKVYNLIGNDDIVKIIIHALNNDYIINQICYELPSKKQPFLIGYDDTGRDKEKVYSKNHQIEIQEVKFDHVRIFANDKMCILEICIEIGPDPSLLQLIEEMTEKIQEQISHWYHEGFVLDPYTIYRLKIITAVTTSEFVDDNSWNKRREIIEYGYFKTKGPIGLSSLSTPICHPNPEEYQNHTGLDDLTLYVKQTIPKTVPDEGEKPPLPKPVYRAYDIGVKYSVDYIEQMYRLEQRDLGFYLYDNNSEPIRDAEGKLIILNNRWGKTEELTLSEKEDYFIRVLKGVNCNLSVDEDKIPRNNEITLFKKGQVLNSNTEYEARLIPLLLHETFSSFPLSYEVIDTSANQKRWIKKDIGTLSTPSHWEIRGEENEKYIIQTSDIHGNTSDLDDPTKEGTILYYGDHPGTDHFDQSTSWTNYRLSAYLRSNSQNSLGLVFRYTDSSNYYRFAMNRGGKFRRLVKINGGSRTILAEDLFIYQKEQDYLITIEVIENSIKIYQNGSLIFNVLDSELDNGTIGLYCWKNSSAQFKDIRIDDFRKESPVIYSFKFITSNFANFFHHLHNYRDELGSIDVESMDLTEAEVLSYVNDAVEPSQSLAESERMKFTELENHLLGSYANQIPTEIRITLITHDERPFAFLFESPEPIDWKRIEMQLLYANRQIAPPKFPEKLKLTHMSLGTDQPNDEYISILIDEKEDVNNYYIEYYHFPSPLLEFKGNPLFYLEEFKNQNIGVIFQEKFGPNALDRYEITAESPLPTSLAPFWRVVDDYIEQIGAFVGITFALTGSEDWQNIRITAKLESSNNNAIGMVFRHQNEDNYYYFSMDSENQTRKLIKKVEGNFVIIWEDSIGYNINQTYELIIDLYNDWIIGYLDNLLLFCEKNVEIRKGKIGFYSRGTRGGIFRALKVETLQLNPVIWKPLFENLDDLEIVDEGEVNIPSQWSVNNQILYQSSDISDGIEVVGELEKFGTCTLSKNFFSDNYSIIANLCSRTGNAIGIIFSYKDDKNYYRFSMDKSKQYRRFIKFVEGTPSILWEDSEEYDIDKIYRITLYNEDNKINCYLDDVNLFTAFDNDQKDGKIGFYCWKNNGAEFSKVSVLNLVRKIGDWTIHDTGDKDFPSAWRFYNNLLIQTSYISDNSIANHTFDFNGTNVIGGDPDWTDYRLTVRMRSDEPGAIGIMFRYLDYNNYYRLSLNTISNTRTLLKRENGVNHVLWEEVGAFLTGEYFDLSIELIGNKIIGYIKDSQKFEILDDAHIKGQIGLYCWGTGSAQYDWVEVERLPIESYTLFKDNFIEDDYDSWTFIDEGTVEPPSDWQIQGSELMQKSNIRDTEFNRENIACLGTQAIVGDNNWSDLVISARIQSQDNDSIGILIRYQDQNNYYRFSMNREFNYRRLVKNFEGTFTVLWEDNYTYDMYRTYEIVIITNNNIIKGYIDGIPMFVVEDDDLSFGRVGLYCWANISAHFSNIRVYPVTMRYNDWLLKEKFEELVVDRWIFVDNGDQNIPSDWNVNNGSLRQLSSINDGNEIPEEVEKLGTYALAGDNEWTDYSVSVRMISNNENEIGIIFRYSDEDNYYRFSMNHQYNYRRLVCNNNGNFETLWEEQYQYIISRENIITINCIGDQITGYYDGVEIFNLQDNKLLKGKIGLSCWKNGGAEFKEVRVKEPLWSSYYAFKREIIPPAGTCIKILSGNANDAFEELPYEEYRHKAEKQDFGNFWFPIKGFDARIINPKGDIIHQRHFFPETEYDLISEVKVLRKEDGTRFLIFVSDNLSTLGSSLSKGQYRIKLIYKRDITGSDPESLILKQTGSSNPEEVIIDIPWK